MIFVLVTLQVFTLEIDTSIAIQIGYSDHLVDICVRKRLVYVFVQYLLEFCASDLSISIDVEDLENLQQVVLMA